MAATQPPPATETLAPPANAAQLNVETAPPPGQPAPPAPPEASTNAGPRPLQATTTIEPPTENPLRAGLTRQEAPDPCVLVLFGATGDLSHRKLFPSLFELANTGQLPANFSVIGVGVGVGGAVLTSEQFREEIRETVMPQGSSYAMAQTVWEDFSKRITLLSEDFASPDCYIKLKQMLEHDEREYGTGGNRVFFMAIPPSLFHLVFGNLYDSGLLYRHEQGKPWTRIMVEKPFGNDLASAIELNNFIASRVNENQVYRIDHYVGKETVQNILAFRFGNSIFEPIWNRRYIDHVQITVAEALGMEGRGGYYDHAGISKDMLQNHMLQVLSLIAMEPPVSIAADDIRDEKVKALHALRKMRPEEVAISVVRGQYGPGYSGGKPVPGYRQEQGVAPESTTETFLALKTYIDNWRWVGVPFYLRSGKRLPRQATEVVIQFRMPPLALFPELEDSDVEPNLLIVRVQPEEGIALRISAKIPGPDIRIQPVRMDFRYGNSFRTGSPTAYERLFIDAMSGRMTLFTRRDEVEASWKVVMPILDSWQSQPAPQFPNYEAGTWGPQAAEDLIEREGRRWHRP